MLIRCESTEKPKVIQVSIVNGAQGKNWASLYQCDDVVWANSCDRHCVGACVNALIVVRVYARRLAVLILALM